MSSIPVVKTYVMLTAVLFLAANGNAGDQSRAFDKTLERNGISFHITCPNEGSLNILTISPSGLSQDKLSRSEEIDGSVTGAAIDDLNGDGSPEIYVFINSAGSGSYGSLVAYSSNNNKSISPIYLPPLEDDAKNSKGYMGHDLFTLANGNLVRQYPVYKQNDSNAKPTGGTRQLYYSLIAGEATWILTLQRSTNSNN